MRDYVIGIHAVDGRGVAFKGGGRVVKNVAGYDFCKLLTGSLGTLGVITQLALKVKPLPERSGHCRRHCHELAVAETILARLVNLAATPTVNRSFGRASAWSEGALPEASTSVPPRLPSASKAPRRKSNGWPNTCSTNSGKAARPAPSCFRTDDADALWSHQIEFADRGAATRTMTRSLVVKIAVPPGAVVATIAELLRPRPVVYNRGPRGQRHRRRTVRQVCSRRRRHGACGQVATAAVARGGSLVVLASQLEGLTPHIIWGGRTDATILMERIKRQFDPHNILNPGRFVY